MKQIIWELRALLCEMFISWALKAQPPPALSKA